MEVLVYDVTRAGMDRGGWLESQCLCSTPSRAFVDACCDSDGSILNDCFRLCDDVPSSTASKPGTVY